jgi:NodT family efflux transporter outer membrane factor (OMF) lipoprotein
MKNLNIVIVFGLLIINLVISGCRSTKILETDKIKNLPESFVNSKDSSNSANLNWKSFFVDTNLQILIDESLSNNYDLLIALQKIERSNNEVKFSKNLLLPNVNAASSVGQRKFGNYTMDWAGNKITEITPGRYIPMHLQDYFVGIQTSWEIDVWGKLRNKKRASLLRFAASIEGKNLIITNLIAEIASSYFQLISLDNELEILKETILNQENSLELMKIQKEVGVVNELAVKQFEAQLLNSKSFEYEIIQKITEEENKICYLVGKFPQKINRSKNTLNSFLSNQLKEGIPSDLLKNRPDIRMSENELFASKADVLAAKAAFYPSLNINGSIGYQAFQARFLFSSPASIAYSILGNISAPLINRNAIKTEFKNANSFQQEALYNYQKSILNGFIEVNNEIAQIKNLQNQLEFKESQTKILNNAIEISLDIFKTGRSNYLEVLNIQNNALQSKIELVNIKMQQVKTMINLYKSLGGGWK